MNRKEAVEYNEELKTILGKVAMQYDIDEKIGKYIVDNFIMVIPDDARKGLVFLGEEPVSYKIGNVKLDLKKALIAGMELVSAINIPESIFNYIQLCIVSVLFIEKAAKVKIGKSEAYIVWYLHTHNAYEVAIEEEMLINGVIETYMVEGKGIEEKDVRAAINELYKIKALNLVDGYVYLAERVWMTRVSVR